MAHRIALLVSLVTLLVSAVAVAGLAQHRTAAYGTPVEIDVTEGLVVLESEEGGAVIFRLDGETVLHENLHGASRLAVDYGVAGSETTLPLARVIRMDGTSEASRRADQG